MNDYKTTTGKINQVVSARIMPDSDMIESIKEICAEKGIETAYFGACIGSLKKITFVYAKNDEERYYKIRYSDPVEMTGAIEFLGAQGIVAKDDDGEYRVHLHAHFSDETMKVYGGHLLDKGNIVLATIDLVINEIADVKLKRNYHEASGFYFFEPTDEER